jgi:hypothetical protein
MYSHGVAPLSGGGGGDLFCRLPARFESGAE